MSDAQNGEGKTDRWLRPAQISELTGISVNQLAQWRLQGVGPRFSKLGHRIVVYRFSDVNEWIEARASLPAA